MARKPKTNHPIRKLRSLIPHGREIGIGQADFAHLVGIRPNTLKAIELGQRRLSFSRGLKIFSATGVNYQTIIDPKGTPDFIFGGPYTTDSYERFKGIRKAINENLRSTGLKALIDFITIVMEAAADRQKATGFYWSAIGFVTEYCVEHNLEDTINRKLKDDNKDINLKILIRNAMKHGFVPPPRKGSAQGKSPKSSPRP